MIFLSMLLFPAFLHAGPGINCNITINHTLIEKNTISCQLLMTVPEGWKIPKIPKISAANAEDASDFVLDNIGKLKKISKTTYQMNFQIKIPITANKKRQLKLQITCPLCNDICTMVSQNILIDFDSSEEYENFLLTLFLGFLGGLILNFMPCVLPVLLLKLRSFLPDDRRNLALVGGICGNCVSFFAFAIFLTLLKMVGNVVGWGMHFQNIWFLKIITVVLFLLTLYAFEIVTFFPSVSWENKSRLVFWKNFMASGVTVLMAIPCTAQFLGTAAAFALQGTIPEMLGIFFAIATGFSLPYIIFLAVPFGEIPKKILKYSDVVKTASNYGILLAFGWIFFLLCNHLSLPMILLCLLIFLLSSLFFKYEKHVAALILIAILPVIPPEQNFSSGATHPNLDHIMQKITDKVAEGRVVLFSISADWCINCKYNEMNLLRSPKVQHIFREKNISFIEADLTKKNDDLMTFISRHGRIGIPFLMLYGPAFPSGLLLSEMPTVEELTEAIEKVELPSAQN
ncbi:MAG: thioredoxin family protein [Holosporaceae bacterium]|nr:thioredoxin family protein [Holosporaceae bacterium]